MPQKSYQVGVVGATGVVGSEMLALLNKFIPNAKITAFASARSAGKTVKANGKTIPVTVLTKDSVPKLDLALFSAGASVSKEYAPVFAAHGAFVIDNSSAWRMDPECPLVVPEVNPHVLAKDKKIIANPNCSTIQMVVALKPIHDAARIKSIRVATYQSVSGAGHLGMSDLEEQAKAWASNKPSPAPKKIPHQIAFNVVPQIDIFVEDDYTKEEMKMVNETRKIMEAPEIQISATCVRVPVFRGHSEAVWIETSKPISPSEARRLLEKAPGIKVVDSPKESRYPMPLMADGKYETFVGRIRRDLASPNGLVFWVVSDNLLKGAALNALQIGQLLINKGLV